jgi:hypothetical protein
LCWKNRQAIKALTVFHFLANLALMKQEIIKKQIRCPRLGHEIALSYCLRESGKLPCSRIINCWSVYFDIETFFKKVLGEEQWRQFINVHPKDKVTSLIEIIEMAKRVK